MKLNIVKLYILHDDDRSKSLGLLFIRLAIGALFVWFGGTKLLGGPQGWQWLGSKMGLIGIHFWPTFWGFLAAATEFFGGLCFMFGFGTRVASFFLSCVMFIATLTLITDGKPFTEFSYPLSLLVIFYAFILMGAGRYSFDYKMRRIYF